MGLSRLLLVGVLLAILTPNSGSSLEAPEAYVTCSKYDFVKAHSEGKICLDRFHEKFDHFKSDTNYPCSSMINYAKRCINAPKMTECLTMRGHDRRYQKVMKAIDENIFPGFAEKCLAVDGEYIEISERDSGERCTIDGEYEATKNAVKCAAEGSVTKALKLDLKSILVSLGIYDFSSIEDDVCEDIEAAKNCFLEHASPCYTAASDRERFLHNFLATRMKKFYGKVEMTKQCPAFSSPTINIP